MNKSRILVVEDSDCNFYILEDMNNSLDYYLFHPDTLKAKQVIKSGMRFNCEQEALNYSWTKLKSLVQKELEISGGIQYYKIDLKLS